MLGMHKRQGDQSYPDKAISIEVMMPLMARFEAAWEVVHTCLLVDVCCLGGKCVQESFPLSPRLSLFVSLLVSCHVTSTLD
jgi:hypothetical protein